MLDAFLLITQLTWHLRSHYEDALALTATESSFHILDLGGLLAVAVLHRDSALHISFLGV